MARERQRVSTRIGDTENRPLLRFDARREALERRLARFRGREIAAVDGGAGLNASSLFNVRELGAILQSRTAQAVVNKVMRNAAARAEDYARKVSRATYETGAFYSNWKAELSADAGGLRTVLKLVNPVPYALYVHRKGTNKDRTVYNTYIKPWIVGTLQEQIIEDILRDLPKAVKAEILGGAR